jgi:hypothetical protein
LFCDRDGYGKIKYDGKKWYLPRLMLTIIYGEIPESTKTRHKCDNPGCANPAHLEMGSMQDNVDDMWAREREYKGEHDWSLGSKNHNSILTEEKVKQIIEDYDSGKFTQQQIADREGVWQTTISKIVRREGWKHVN